MFALFPLLTGCSLQAEPEAPPPRQQAPEARLQRGPKSPTPDWTVDCNGGGDFPTISAAIDAAVSREWIEVAPCNYPERVDYDGKSVWISSSDGPTATSISGSGIHVDQGEGIGTALVGFTVVNNNSAALDLDLSAIYLQDVVFSNNSGTNVIYSRSGDLRMDNVTIDASNSPWGAAIDADKGVVIMTRSTVVCGSGDALQADHGSLLVDWSTLDCTGGGSGDHSFQTEHGVGRIQRSTLTGSVDIVSEDDHPEDHILFENDMIFGDIDVEYGTLVVRNSILGGNTTLTDTGGTEVFESSIFMGSVNCAVDGNVVPLTVRNNDFFGPTTQVCGMPSLIGANGNLGVDPQFVNPLGLDFHLAAGSPLIDAGIPDTDRQDPDGTRNDIGVYGGHFSQDGGW